MVNNKKKINREKKRYFLFLSVSFPLLLVAWVNNIKHHPTIVLGACSGAFFTHGDDLNFGGVLHSTV